MQIIGEVNQPKTGKKPEMRFWFDGPGSDKPFKATELNAWEQALRQFADAAKDVAARMAKKR